VAPFNEFALRVGSNELVRVTNDRLLPERGAVRLVMEVAHELPLRRHVFPRRLVIPAGLRDRPFQQARTLGIFPDWRLSTLAAIGAKRRSMPGARANARISA
jgi:hypothetical protein